MVQKFKFSGTDLVPVDSQRALEVEAVIVNQGISDINNSTQQDTPLACSAVAASPAYTLSCDAGNGVSILSICDTRTFSIVNSDFINLRQGPPGVNVPNCQTATFNLV